MICFVLSWNIEFGQLLPAPHGSLFCMQSKIAASMGMDTAVESMHQLGFGKQLVPEMLKELLDVSLLFSE